MGQVAGLILALLFCTDQARAAGEESWPTRIMGHFYVHHQSPTPPKDLIGGIEKAYAGLLKDFWSLGGAMQTRKVELFLYSTHQEYLAGRFKPPAWSNGFARSPLKRDGQRVFVTHAQADMRTVKHELSHLFLGAVWGDARRGSSPPRWLDEGLAVIIGGDSDAAERPQAMAEFLKTSPDHSASATDARVTDWYGQAGSVVGFLRKAPGGRFLRLVAALRDGESAERALRMVYGYADLAAFERAWLKAVAPPIAAPAASVAPETKEPGLPGTPAAPPPVPREAPPPVQKEAPRPKPAAGDEPAVGEKASVPLLR